MIARFGLAVAVMGAGVGSVTRAGTGPASSALTLVHDTHVSHTRMVLEGRTIACRVRLFKDDLERALRVETRHPELRITAGDRADSAFAKYFSRAMVLRADGRPVALHLTGSGTEKDEAAHEVVWYLFEGGLEGPGRRVAVLDGLLFEHFRDQQNILLLLRLPEDRRQTLYFVATDPREQTVAF